MAPAPRSTAPRLRAFTPRAALSIRAQMSMPARWLSSSPSTNASTSSRALGRAQNAAVGSHLAGEVGCTVRDRIGEVCACAEDKDDVLEVM